MVLELKHQKSRLGLGLGLELTAIRRGFELYECLLVFNKLALQCYRCEKDGICFNFYMIFALKNNTYRTDHKFLSEIHAEDHRFGRFWPVGLYDYTVYELSIHKFYTSAKNVNYRVYLTMIHIYTVDHVRAQTAMGNNLFGSYER